MAKEVEFRKPNRIVWSLILIVSGAALCYHWTRDVQENRVVAAPLREAKPAGKTIKVQIHPDKWSEWVLLPQNVRFQIDGPDWMECWFVDGRKTRVDNKYASFLGSIPNNTFRLRGARGEAVILIEPK